MRLLDTEYFWALLALLLSVWNSPSETYDLTGDGMVNAQDLSTLLFAWTE